MSATAGFFRFHAAASTLTLSGRMTTSGRVLPNGDKGNNGRRRNLCHSTTTMMTTTRTSVVGGEGRAHPILPADPPACVRAIDCLCGQQGHGGGGARGRPIVVIDARWRRRWRAVVRQHWPPPPSSSGLRAVVRIPYPRAVSPPGAVPGSRIAGGAARATRGGLRLPMRMNGEMRNHGAPVAM